MRVIAEQFTFTNVEHIESDPVLARTPAFAMSGGAITTQSVAIVPSGHRPAS